MQNTGLHTNQKREKLLASYAVRTEKMRGRMHSEEEHPYRSPFQRDRDRIVHSSAFRRLETKTQVYTLKGDYVRKRLTHTLEVAQISRNIARELGLNEDLTEAVALAHDLGHAPFGHKGEGVLQGLMKDDGGFDHNTQALRILCIIESRYPEFPGLNLTYEVREAIAKKGKDRQVEPLKDEFRKFKHATLEGQVVDIADSIAYTTHDLDDGITSQTITADVLKKCEPWNEGKEITLNLHPDLEERPKILKYQIVRHIINEHVTDVINATREKLKEANPQSPDDVRNAGSMLCSLSEPMRKKHQSLKDFLVKNMYDNYVIKRTEIQALRIIEGLFNAFMESPDLFPEGVRAHYHEKKKEGGEKRIVCDYIAGMTDGFALQEHKKIFDPTEMG